jgi:hypothetical protein
MEVINLCVLVAKVWRKLKDGWPDVIVLTAGTFG